MKAKQKEEEEEEGGGVVVGEGWGGCHVGTQDELMFRLFRVSVSIFPGLTDRPINLIYRVSPHPLTSSTGLLSNNERQRSGTVGALVPIVLARRAIIKVTQRKKAFTLSSEWAFFCDRAASRGVARAPICARFMCSRVK